MNRGKRMYRLLALLGWIAALIVIAQSPKSHSSRDESTDAERYATWRAYLNVRGFMVRRYFTSPITWIVFGTLVITEVVAFVLQYLWDSENSTVSLAGFTGTRVVALLLILVVTFLVTLLAVPAVRAGGGGLVDWPYIKLCNRFLDHHQASYVCHENLKVIRELAETNAGASWGAVTILSVLFAANLALLSTGVNERYPNWASPIWAAAFAFGLLSILLTLVASADTVIKQAVTLRCKQRPEERGTSR